MGAGPTRAMMRSCATLRSLGASMIARHHRVAAPASLRALCSAPPSKLSKEALAKLGVAPTVEVSSEASRRAKDKLVDEFGEDEFEGRLALDEKPPQLGVLGAFMAAGLGMLGFSAWRGYEGKYIWPKIDGQVIQWQMGGSVVNPVATLQFVYTIDQKTFYFGEEELSVVHFDSQKVCTQMSVYDLYGQVDVHYDPDDHAKHVFEPSYMGSIMPRSVAISKPGGEESEATPQM